MLSREQNSHTGTSSSSSSTPLNYLNPPYQNSQMEGAVSYIITSPQNHRTSANKGKERLRENESNDETLDEERKDTFETILNNIRENNAKEISSIDLSHISLSSEQLLNLRKAVLSNNIVGYISWGELPQDNDADIGRIVSEIEEKLAENNRNYRYYPTDFVFGLLSHHSYIDAKEGDKLEFTTESYNQYVTDWEVLKVYDETKSNGYYAAIYINKNTCQLVLAHRGSEFDKKGELLRLNSGSDWTADFRGVLAGFIVSQQASAYYTTDEAVKLAREFGYSLSVTGHSLGAWLAEHSVLFCHKDFGYKEIKAVTFDSPGIGQAWKKFKSNVFNSDTKISKKELNIVTYLSAPNVVNCCNMHIGKVYRLFPKIEYPKWMERYAKLTLVKGFYTNIGHMLETFILSQFNPQTGIPDEYHVVKDWPKIEYTGEPVKNQLIKGALGLVKKWVPSFLEGVFDNTVDKILKSFGVDHSIIVITDLLLDIANGKINQEQYWTTFKYIDHSINNRERLNLSSKDKFTLAYEGHYKTEEPGAISVLSKNLFPNGYLFTLYKEPGRVTYISESLRDQLEHTTSLYMIWERGKKYYLEPTRGVNTDHLTQWIRRIIEVAQKERLLEKLTEVPRQRMLDDTIPTHILYPQESDFTGREEIFKQIESIFQNDNIIVLRGAPGVGKTSIATQYAHSVKGNQCVRWFAAETKEQLDLGYSYLASELGVNISDLNPEEIRRAVNNKIQGSKNILFIFDNLEEAEKEYWKEYSGHLPSNIKLLITTKNESIINDYKAISIEPFSTELALRYIRKNIKEKDVKQEDIDKLIENIGLMPLRLKITINDLNSRPFLRLEDYLNAHELRKREDPLSLNALTEIGGESWKVLQYCAYLNPDYIPISIFLGWVGNNELELGVMFKPLISRSLVRVTADKKGIYIHRTIQDEVIRYINEKKAKHDLEILSNLAARIEEMFPIIDDNPDQKWREAETLILHTTRISEECSKAGIKNTTLARLNNKLGIYYTIAKHDYNQSLHYLYKALSISNKVRDQTQIGISLSNIGNAYESLGDAKEALKYYRESLRISRRIYKNQDHPDIATSLDNIGNAYFSLSKAQEALKYYRESLRISRRIYKNQDHPDIAASLSNIGKAYNSLGDAQEALKYHRKTLKMARNIYTDQDHPIIATSLGNIGSAYNSLGNAQEAFNHHDKALKMRERMYKDQDHPDIAQSLNNIGYAYHGLGKPKKALKYFQKYLEMMRRIYKDQDHPDIAQSLNNIGYVYNSLSEFQEALQYHKKALGINRRIYKDQDHLNIAVSHNCIGDVYASLGDFQKALKYYKKVLVTIKKIYQDHDHPDIAFVLTNIGIAYGRLGSSNKALEYFKQAYSIHYKCYNSEHPNVKIAERNLKKIQPDFFDRKYISFDGTPPNTQGLKVGNEYRMIIKKHSTYSEGLLELELTLQKGVLNKIHTLSASGHWSYKYPTGIYDWGIKGYLEERYLKKKLGDLGNNKENIKQAKMLCFEAMNIGIMCARIKYFELATEFTKCYTALVRTIATEHPEYFVDGSIIEACIMAFPKDPEWKQHLLQSTGLKEEQVMRREGFVKRLNKEWSFDESISK